MLIVHQLAGILLDMDALDADGLGGAALEIDLNLSFADDRVIELADLVTLRQIRVSSGQVRAVNHRANPLPN